MQESQEIAKNRILANKEASKKIYDKKSHDISFSVGDKVYFETKSARNKLTPQWTGPFEILEILPNGVNIAIKHKNKRKVLHKNLLKPHYS